MYYSSISPLGLEVHNSNTKGGDAMEFNKNLMLLAIGFVTFGIGFLMDDEKASDSLIAIGSSLIITSTQNLFN